MQDFESTEIFPFPSVLSAMTEAIIVMISLTQGRGLTLKLRFTDQVYAYDLANKSIYCSLQSENLKFELFWCICIPHFNPNRKASLYAIVFSFQFG